MKGAWKLALRGLGRNRRRSLATGAAIAFGYAAMILLGGYILRVNDYLRTVAIYLQHSGHLAIYKRGGLELHRIRPLAYSLSPDEQARIRQVLGAEPDVELAVPYLLGNGLAGNGCKSVPFTARGVDPALERRLRTHPLVREQAPELARPLRGELLAASPELAHPVALSTGLARLLGKPRVHGEVDPGRPPEALQDCGTEASLRQIASDANVQLAASTDSGSFSAVDGDVVGIFSTGLSETEDSAVLTSLGTLQELYETERVTSFAVYLREYGGIAERARRLEARLRAQGLDVAVYPFDDEAVNPYYVGVLGFLLVLGGFISLVIFSVVLLSIVNSMTLSILERTREIGTLRSLGFTRGQLQGLFVREGVLLTALAMGGGLLLALATAWGVNGQDIRFSPPGVPGTVQFQLAPNAPLCAGLAVVLEGLAVLATLAATRSRTRENIVKLMTALSG